jgi:hypothetical protein
MNFESPDLDDLCKAHLNLINLETSVTAHHVPWPNKAFNYRMHPCNIDFLEWAKVDYTTLANNHTLDFGEKGLRDTVATLRKAGVAFAGAGDSKAEAEAPAVLDLPKRRIPVEGKEGESEEEQHVDECLFRVHVHAGSDHPSDWAPIPTFNFIEYTPAGRARLQSQLLDETFDDDFDEDDDCRKPTFSHKRPQRRLGCDLKIFSVHWGPNYCLRPASEIRELAHFLIDECGVDVVHGHSSHHVQGVERYGDGKLIIYGCGDFVDDYAVDHRFRNDLGAVWRLKVTERGEGQQQQQPPGRRLKVQRLEIFPTRIAQFQVNLLDPEDDDWEFTRRRLEKLSKELDTDVRSEGDKLVVDL